MPNPYSCTVHGGLEIVGTSGQNLHDLMSNTDLECPLEALERLLKWGHLVPTSPDTLGCYPFEDKDPFVMARKPAVFFAANQKTFGQKVITHQVTLTPLVHCWSMPPLVFRSIIVSRDLNAG